MVDKFDKIKKSKTSSVKNVCPQKRLKLMINFTVGSTKYEKPIANHII